MMAHHHPYTVEWQMENYITDVLKQNQFLMVEFLVERTIEDVAKITVAIAITLSEVVPICQVRGREACLYCIFKQSISGTYANRLRACRIGPILLSDIL
jgi:hypothetical protein